MAILLNTGAYHTQSVLQHTNHRQLTTDQWYLPTSSNREDGVSIHPEFQMGDDMVLSLGRIALGGSDQLGKWAEQGLEVSEASIRQAFETFNDAFQEYYNNPESKNFVINRHQIIENNQDVPAWFKKEKNYEIKMISNPGLKASFEAGDQFHINVERGLNGKALGLYQSIGTL